MQAIQNLGLAIFSIVTGILLQNYGYFALELFFILLCLVALMSVIILFFLDTSRSKSASCETTLNSPHESKLLLLDGTLSLSKSKREELTL